MALDTLTRRATAHLAGIEAMLEPDHRGALGLSVDELEELLVAIGDRQDLEADQGRRARLARGRAALERELSRAISVA